MSASQRRKGQSGEREVCALLQGEFGVKVGRKLSQCRDSGNDVDIGPFCIEVKRRARIGNVYEWMAQAEFSAPDGNVPVVFMRGDGHPWLVLMNFIDWARLAREELSDARNTDTHTSGVVDGVGAGVGGPVGADHRGDQ